MIIPFVGMPALYRWRPGQVRAGQEDAAAIITKVYHDGFVDLIVMPPGHPDQHLFQNRIGRMTQEVTSNCWHPQPWMENLFKRLGELEERLAEIEGGGERRKQLSLAGKRGG